MVPRGNLKFPLCVELVCYKPSRRSAKNRSPTQIVLGFTAWDECAKCYRPIAEIDTKPPLQDLLRSWPPWMPRPLMIFETVKGYHIVMEGCYRNPTKLMKILTSWKMLNRDHLKLGYLRVQGKIKCTFKGGWVLRFTPKYGNDTPRLVYIARGVSYEPWYTEVLLLYMGVWRKLGWEPGELCRKAKQVDSLNGVGACQP